MNLLTYNRETSSRMGIPKISVGKAGAIVLNPPAASLLNIKAEDKVEIVQDQDRPKDWFIRLNAGEEGFVLRNAKGGGLAFSSAAVGEAIRRSINFEVSMSMLLAKESMVLEDITYWPIITSSAK